jgi:hypothetical protein
MTTTFPGPEGSAYAITGWRGHDGTARFDVEHTDDAGRRAAVLTNAPWLDAFRFAIDTIGLHAITAEFTLRHVLPETAVAA